MSLLVASGVLLLRGLVADGVSLSAVEVTCCVSLFGSGKGLEVAYCVSLFGTKVADGGSLSAVEVTCCVSLFLPAFDVC